MLIKLINIFISKFNNFIKNEFNIRYSFWVPLILSKLNIDIQNLPIKTSDDVYNLALGIFILALICLFNFINVVGYLIAIILIKKFDIETKFSKFKKVIKYFENSSLFFVIFEGILCLLCLIAIVAVTLVEIINK